MKAGKNPSFILPMDVRQKQRLFYHGSSEPAACVLPVSADVDSTVWRFTCSEG